MRDAKSSGFQVKVVGCTSLCVCVCVWTAYITRLKNKSSSNTRYIHPPYNTRPHTSQRDSRYNRMIRHLAVLVVVIAAAYVLSKPTPDETNIPHHRTKRWEDFPNLTFTFDCSDRAVGFYADTEHHCQIFHMCDEDGRRIPYICANETSFNQEFRICDWEYNFDCADAEKWYYLNELTYVTDPPKEIKNNIVE